MRITVNLATRPFVEMRPMFARLRLMMLGLLLLAAGLGFALHILSGKGKVAQSQMDVLKSKTAAYQSQRQQDEARMRQPQNMAVLERSQFLNTVFAEKSFSWTAVMMDLERVLPPGVQVTSIEPVITKTGDVNIRLRVSGDRDRAVELVRNLETSQRFLRPRLASESAQAQEANRRSSAAAGTPVAVGTVEFDILSGYNPLPEVRLQKAAGVASDHRSAAGDSTFVRHSGKPRKKKTTASRTQPARKGGA